MNVDVAIVGAGPVGASLARALAPTGLNVALVEARPVRQLPTAGFDQRVYTLNRHSRRFLEDCGAWRHLLPLRISPVREMRVFGDDASQIEFSAYRSGVPELATIVEETNLQQALHCALLNQANFTLLSGVRCERVNRDVACATLSLSDGQCVEARLLVAADGADSAIRSEAGIAVRVHEYGQTGVVGNFRAGLEHRETAYQWFLHNGVLALLPLPDNHVSMVWSADDAHARVLLDAPAEQLARMVEEASGGIVGMLEPVSAAAGFPLRRLQAARLIAPRLALVGDTAHNVHPLAGQGLNLGIGDAQALATVLAARGMESDSGAYSLLRRFERGRREDLVAMAAVTDGLQLLFSTNLPGMKQLRNAGLRLVNRISPLKRFLVKRALG
jgi:ubiquinone biosynthesis UbiH/UbiF/VisC/COQ6 family hydroxylase